MIDQPGKRNYFNFTGGNSNYREKGTVVTLWGDDQWTPEKDGLYIGEEFTIQLLRLNQSVSETIHVDRWEDGSGVYSINGISVAGSLSQNIIQEKQLIKITDILGRDINMDSKQSTLLYIYDDGSIERKYILQ